MSKTLGWTAKKLYKQTRHDLLKDGPKIAEYIKNSENRSNLLAHLKLLNPYSHEYYPVLPQTKDRRSQEYKRAGYKFVERLLNLYHSSVENVEFYSILIEFPAKPLYSAKANAQRVAATKKLIKYLPAYYKFERNDTPYVKTHAHIISLLPTSFKFPQTINKYAIKYEKLGEKPQFSHLSLEKNVSSYVKYLLKPADARCLYGRDSMGKPRGRYRDDFYIEALLQAENSLLGEGTAWDTGLNLRGSLNL